MRTPSPLMIGALHKELLNFIFLISKIASKITDAEVKDNFTILLHCLHFLTKRSFVYTPKDVDPITIGRTKSKERKPKTDLPPAGTHHRAFIH